MTSSEDYGYPQGVGHLFLSEPEEDDMTTWYSLSSDDDYDFPLFTWDTWDVWPHTVEKAK